MAVDTLTEMQPPAGGLTVTEKLSYARQLEKQLLAASWAPCPAQESSERTATARVMPKSLLHMFMKEAAAVLYKEPTLLEVQPASGQQVMVVGDTHGQLHDLCHLFNKFGHPSTDRIYIFNGDYVDRGAWGVETLALLLVYKWMLPHNVYLVRGNHETSFCTECYGFQSELCSKYGTEDGQALIKFAVGSLFPSMPLAACVASSTLILHGGLFRVVRQVKEDEAAAHKPKAKRAKKDPSRPRKAKSLALVTGSLQDLRTAHKANHDPDPDTETGRNMHQLLASDVLWSDPSPHPGHHSNDLRGVGSVFGPDVTEAFLSSNGLKLIIRSHEGPDARAKRRPEDKMPSVDNGYSVDHDTPSGRLVTLFSAPDYPQFMADGEERYRNKGAVLHLDAPGYHTPTVESFEAVLPRPEAFPYYNMVEQGSDSDSDSGEATPAVAGPATPGSSGTQQLASCSRPHTTELQHTVAALESSSISKV